MAISVVMPALEMAQETGKLVSWLKKEGERVSKGEPLLEVETDKAVLEVEAAADGILAGITGEVGTDIQVGQVIAWIVAAGEPVPASAGVAASVTASVAEAARPTEQLPELPAPSAGPPAAQQLSPKARRLAKEAGIDIHTVHGSGPGGEVLAADIQAVIDGKGADGKSAPTQSASLPKDGAQPLSSIGRLMAQRTAQSWTTVPHFFLQRDVDASALNAARTMLGPAIEQSHEVKLTHTDLLIALVAHTLAKHPRVNASWIDDGVRLNAEVNVAIAMAVEGGVVTAVAPNAHTATLGQIAQQRRELTERARAGRLRPADVAGGTFTISNLGMFHIDSFLAIITPPQAAILAVGQIADRAVARNGVVVVRPMLSLTLSSDHRVMDGATAAIFLRDLAEAIEEPESRLILNASA